MVLDMHDICRSFPLGKERIEILHNVSLQLVEGEYMAIMGPSGSGKSTLMNIIGCLDVQTSGSYFLNGEDVSLANSDRLAEIRNTNLGFVFQSFFLLPKLTAVENVALPLMYAGVKKSERRERAVEALKSVGLGDRLDHRPNQLSGGQCQRVAIARAIINNPALLLADEPTGALDTASGEQVMRIFEDLNRKGTTILVITHEPSVADCAHIQRHIRDGRMYLGKGEQNEIKI